ncbi:MAG: hypothetical protein A2V65_10635 [Deltaproteobacteria bacterium RBG_13_49_15]|nr:MAG: hypothetical protein A2V65_10635 [Deltaproteobacteria bacterium RBG_13_49_15]
MPFRITTLVDNTVSAGKGLIGEHGLSFLIESGGRKILFDTGQGFALPHNAGILGIKLSEVDTVVLSHGHYDHTGGLKSLLSCNSTFSLIAHPGVFVQRFSKREGRTHEIGIPMMQRDFEKKGVRMVLDQKPQPLAPGITTTGEIPIECGYEFADDSLFILNDRRMVQDPLEDDQALFLETSRGIVILFGCAHRGPINTLKHVLKMTGTREIHAVIGGLHLMKASKERIEKVVESFSKFKVKKIMVGHCTGFDATVALYREFQGMVSPNSVGSVMEIP